MKFYDLIETIFMYLICLFEFIEKLYVRLYPYFALAIGIVILIGIVGGAEGDINNNYYSSIIKIATTFIILTLLWKIGKLKVQRERKNHRIHNIK